MPALPLSIARAAASLCEEIWNSLSGENRGWRHLERWTLLEPHSQERATFLAAAVYAANSKCRLLHTGCGVRGLWAPVLHNPLPVGAAGSGGL